MFLPIIGSNKLYFGLSLAVTIFPIWLDAARMTSGLRENGMRFSNNPIHLLQQLA